MKDLFEFLDFLRDRDYTVKQTALELFGKPFAIIQNETAGKTYTLKVERIMVSGKFRTQDMIIIHDETGLIKARAPFGTANMEELKKVIHFKPAIGFDKGVPINAP